MTKTLWRSAFVAALFALHPLHVESVAWVAERKDVFSTLFWMLTLGAYAYYRESPGYRRYLLVLVCFIMGLMSKPMLVTCPLFCCSWISGPSAGFSRRNMPGGIPVMQPAGRFH